MNANELRKLATFTGVTAKPIRIVVTTADVLGAPPMVLAYSTRESINPARIEVTYTKEPGLEWLVTRVRVRGPRLRPDGEESRTLGTCEWFNDHGHPDWVDAFIRGNYPEGAP